MAPTTNANTANTTTVHVLASNTTSIDKKQIEEEALRVRDAATRSQKWRTLAILNLFKDPLYDPPPTPDMTLIEPFKTTDFPTFLGQNIADPDTRPRKRRRLDKATLHHIIPDPHIIPPPTTHRPRDPDLHTKIPPFKSNPIKLLQPTSSAKLRDKYGRMAWIIPVRGAPLIAGTSGAIFSKSPAGEVLTQLGYNVPANPPTAAIAVAAIADGHDPTSVQEASTLQWTAPTLFNFWMFLLRLHQTSVFGPLAISFQPRQFAPLLRPTPDVRWGLDAFETTPIDAEEEKQRRRWLGERLAETDYIKIYHDAMFALNVRQLIETYRDDEMVREWCSPKGQGHSRAEGHGMTLDNSKEELGNLKRRAKENNKDRGKAWKPFKGIKLLLVDELGEPFLIA